MRSWSWGRGTQNFFSFSLFLKLALIILALLT
jgi:hypothetical protein